MSRESSKIWIHYQKLQESLTELKDPGFTQQTRSFSLIILNQTYTHAERLFELAESTMELSRGREATLAKLAHHIENTKDFGLSHCLHVIRDRFSREFDLVS